MPPWLWLWLIGDLAVLIPAEVSNERHQLTLYTGHGEIAPQVTAGMPYTLLLLFTILSGLTYAIFAAGVIATAFPQLRCRRVERRFGLVPDGAEDGAVLAGMRDFVARYDPAIRLRAVARDDQMARIYPVSWRTARIAVFRPLPELWRRDREAAQAVLLREVAHRRHGDQLVVGLASPLVWLMRIWVPAFVVLALTPVVVYAALGGGLLAARGGYITALTDFRTAGLDLREDQVSAAIIATEDGITADQAATAILTSQLARCRH